MSGFAEHFRHYSLAALTAFGLACSPLMSSAAVAQSIETIDPDGGIDADLDAPATQTQDYDEQATPSDANDPVWMTPEETDATTATPPPADYVDGTPPVVTAPPPPEDAGTTYKEDDLIGAAEGIFGKGAEGLARLIEDLLEKQGEPNGYIVGREASGAFIVGARYGSGTFYHKVEGEMPVYWTGPSIGFDAGANAGNTFVLVYNLYDSEELYERYPAGEGQAYAIGGLTASYLRKGDVVLIPIRVGAGLRLGINAGYMRFSKKQRWLPF